MTREQIYHAAKEYVALLAVKNNISEGNNVALKEIKERINEVVSEVQEGSLRDYELFEATVHVLIERQQKEAQGSAQ